MNTDGPVHRSFLFFISVIREIRGFDVSATGPKRGEPRMTRMAADTKKERQEDEGQENRVTACDCQSAVPRQSMIFLSPIFLSFPSRLYPRPSASSAAHFFVFDCGQRQRRVRRGNLMDKALFEAECSENR